MAANRQDVSRWKSIAHREGSRYIISACDTFEWEDYPVYCKDKKELAKQYHALCGLTMTKINEIIDVDANMENLTYNFIMATT